MHDVILGIDIGATHIKAAPVDTTEGEPVCARELLVTPQPGTPEQVVHAVVELSDRFGWGGSLGIGFPGVVQDGVIRTAAHVAGAWTGVDLGDLLGHEFRAPTTVVNDADAAGMAELTFGAGYGHRGVVIVVTLGAGVGSAVFVDGTLLPNTELGHLRLGGRDLEARIAARAHTGTEGKSWPVWGLEVSTYLQSLEDLFWPDLFIIGGDVSVDFHSFESYLHTRTPVMAAALGADAGIVGAALARRRASDREHDRSAP